MHLVKLASSIMLISFLSACSTTQTSSINQDSDFNPNLLPATAAGIKTANGYIRYWEYSNINGTDLAGLYASSDYPLLYSKSSRLTTMSKNVTLSSGGARMAGYIYPAITGKYHFKLETSSGGELWISSDRKAYKKKKIIHLNKSGPDQTALQSSSNKRSIWLEAGKSYYIEAVAKINKDGDVLNVYWSYPTPKSPEGLTSSPMEIIPGSVMQSYGRNRVETPSIDYIDGIKAGYALAYTDSNLGISYSDHYPPIDSDFDGIPDKWEESYGLNPLNYNDASLDEDGDGLTAFEEYMARTEPYIADSDGDGIPDGWEVSYGLNPTYVADAVAIDAATGLTYLAMWQKSNDTPHVGLPLGTENGLYLNWQAPSERVNGDVFSESDVKQYILHYKLAGTEEFIKVTVDDPNATEFLIDGVEPGTYQVGISVVDNNDLESAVSPLADKIVE